MTRDERPGEAEPLSAEEERLLRFARSIGGAPIDYGPVDAVDRLLATLDAERSRASGSPTDAALPDWEWLAQALIETTEDPNTFQSTEHADYWRWVAESIALRDDWPFRVASGSPEPVLEPPTIGPTTFGSSFRGFRGPLVIVATMRHQMTPVRVLLPGQVYVKDVLALAANGDQVFVLDGVRSAAEWTRVDELAALATHASPAALAPEGDQG